MPTELEPFDSRSFRFACEIVQLYRKFIKSPEIPHVIARQVLRAGTSIGANLAEAKGAQSRRDTAAKFSIALKEARETNYWLRLLDATKLAETGLLRSPLNESDELIAILTVARRNLKEPEESTS